MSHPAETTVPSPATPQELRLTLRRWTHSTDLYLIERADNGGFRWEERRTYGLVTRKSSRFAGDADVEGSAAEMLEIARAIRVRREDSFKRVAVDARGARVQIWSPRCSNGAVGEISHEEALRLAAEIEDCLAGRRAVLPATCMVMTGPPVDGTFFTVDGCNVAGTFPSFGAAVAAWVNAGAPEARGNSVWVSQHLGAETIGPTVTLGPPDMITIPGYLGDYEVRALVRQYVDAGAQKIFAQGREAVELAETCGVWVMVVGDGPGIHRRLSPDVANAALDHGADASRFCLCVAVLLGKPL